MKNMNIFIVKRHIKKAQKICSTRSCNALCKKVKQLMTKHEAKIKTHSSESRSQGESTLRRPLDERT